MRPPAHVKQVVVDLTRPLTAFLKMNPTIVFGERELFEIIDEITDIFEEPDPEGRDIAYASLLEVEFAGAFTEDLNSDECFALETSLIILGENLYDEIEYHGLFRWPDQAGEFYFPYVLHRIAGMTVTFVTADRYHEECIKAVDREVAESSYSPSPFR